MYSEMLKEALNQGYEEMEELAEEIFEHLKEKDECKYWKMYFKMYEVTHGKHLNEEMAEKWVHSMKPYGEHMNIRLGRFKYDYDTTKDKYPLGFIIVE